MKNTQENSKKVNKILFIVFITLLGATLILTTVWALFSARKTANSDIRIGKIDVELQEDWPNQGDPVDPATPGELYDEFGIKKYAKVVKGHSLGDLPAYVRIRCIPIVQYYYVEDEATEGEWITAPISQEDIVVSINGTDWVNSGDYYYYKKILEGFGTTGDLNIGWEIVEVPSEIKQYRIRADVRVILEYSQTTNDAWKEIFQINTLPEGVEVFTQNAG